MAGKRAGARASGGMAVRKRARGEPGEPGAVPPPPPVTDARFAALHWDPRFSRVPKRAAKVDVDERFRGELLRNPAFRGSTAAVDRFGREKAVGGGGDVLERVYDMGESGEESGGESGDESEEESGDESGDESGNESADERETDGGGNMNGGEVRGERESGHVGSDVEVEEGGKEMPLDGREEAKTTRRDDDEEVIARGSATRRLAVMGLDWSNTRAVDIFASLQSFCPPGKLLKEVRIHPSKFGLQRLEAESKLGPVVLSKLDQELLEKRPAQPSGPKSEGQGSGQSRIEAAPGDDREEASESEASESEASDGEAREGSDSEGVSGDSSSDGDESEEDFEPIGRRSILASNEEGQDEQDALRKYEEERLKYYYAVAEFEDASAADAVYEQCDGVEFESTGLAMDLRFVPDAMVIDAPVREASSGIPDGYAPPNLAPSTLNNCKVKLSWDADAPDRAVLKKRNFGKHEEDEANLKAYLASASESEESQDGAEGGAKELARKRALLLGGNEGGESASNQLADEDMEMEVTFEPGLAEKGEDIIKRKMDKEAKKDESHWESRLRRIQEKKSEKRRLRKEQIKRAQGSGEENGNSAGESDDSLYGDLSDNPRFANDPFFNTASDEEQGATVEEHPQKSKTRMPANSAKKSGRNRRQAGAEDEAPGMEDPESARRKANLELIMMDDDRKKGYRDDTLRDRLLQQDSDDEGRRARTVEKGAKAKRSRGRRRSDREAAKVAALENGTATAMDVADERFADLFSSHKFAMDPTHPKFKRNATTEKILAERSRRGGSTAYLGANVGATGANDRPFAADAKAGKLGTEASGVAASSTNENDVMKLAAAIKNRYGTRKIPK